MYTPPTSEDDPDCNGWNTWRKINTAIRLFRNMRADTDTVFQALLNRARDGQLDDDDVDMLLARQFASPPPNSVHAFPLNEQVAQHNQTIFAKSPVDSRVAVWAQHDCVSSVKHIEGGRTREQVPAALTSGIVHHLHTAYPGGKVKRGSAGVTYISKKAIDHDNDKKARSVKVMPAKLELAIGMRVMITKNLATQLSLVNGSIGVVVGVIKQPQRAFVACANAAMAASHHDKLGLPIVLVKFTDRAYFGPSFDADSDDLIVPITAVTEDLCRMTGTDYIITRTQLPLVPAEAVTIHKVQGLTLDNVVTGHFASIRQLGAAYVAFSRVRSIKNLFLVPGASARVIRQKVNGFQKDRKLLNIEDKRIDQIVQATTVTYQHLLQQDKQQQIDQLLSLP